NLWAGLVSTIFEKLDDYIEENVPEKKQKAEVEQKLTEKLQILSDQKRAILKEKQELDRERKDLIDEITTAHDSKEKLLERIRVTSLKNLREEAFARVKPLGDNVKKSLADFGITEDRLSALSPNALNDELRSWATFGKNFLKFRTRDKVFFGLAFVAFTIFIIDPGDFFQSRIHEIGKVAAMLVTVIGPVLKKWLDTFEKFKNLVSPVMEFKNNFNEEVRIAEYDHEKKLRLLQAELGEQDSKISNLAVNLAAKEKEIQDVEYALKHSITKQAFFNFIQKKNDEGGYEKHLGIISTVRRDFEALSNLFKGANESGEKIEADIEFLKKFAKPLDRIILYIDDLDRCSDEKVIEVLQAVHLLMAYPLFIVVVGVDKRCVHNALTYRNLLQYSQFTKNGNPELLQDLGIRIIQPAEYLEKIFQIPFHVERASEDKIKKMVRSLLEQQLAPDPISPEQEQALQAARDLAALGEHHQLLVDADRLLGQQAGPARLDTQAATAHPSSDAKEEEATVRYLPPKDLKLTKTELRCLEEMTSLVGTTPRTVKRYINMYRIIRAHELLSYKEDLRDETFLIIMFILSVNVGRYHAMADRVFSGCQKHPDMPLRDILENDAYDIQKKLAGSPQLRPLLDFPGSSFVDHIRFVRRFSFNTQEQAESAPVPSS
ncbi:MAG TPA: P-loop NTPase fold protein, partial [Chryseosolibacter sp.]|nr:P-loop NTPase fold protein [Chryseosolibacter sp.]